MGASRYFAAAWRRACRVPRWLAGGVRRLRLPSGPSGLRLNVGCGRAHLAGWVNLDVTADGHVRADIRRGLPVRDGQAIRIYNEHMIEHLTSRDGLAFLGECHRALAPGGILRVATPDLGHLVERYHGDWRADQDWLTWPEYQYIQSPAEMLNVSMHSWGHQYLYDAPELERRLGEAGFGKIVQCTLGESAHTDLRGLETRPDSRLIMEAERE